MHEYEYEAMYGLEDSYWWFVARRILAEELIGGEVNGRREPRILDIGCGTGANMKTFGRHGMTAGIDTSIEALHFCQKRGLQTVAVSAVERLPFDNGSFDVITALDVLEHTDDDLDALREIRRVARDKALLLMLKWMNLPFGVSVIALARPSRPLPTSPASARAAKYDGGG